jgi:hypothetical protein
VIFDRNGAQIRIVATGSIQHTGASWEEGRFGAAHGNNLWLEHRNQYKLEQWSVEGKLVRTLVRNAEWFPPWPINQEVWGQPDIKDPPMIGRICTDSAGRIWTVTRVARLDWKARPRTDPHAVNPPGYDTYIEVIDGMKGTLLASERMHRFIGGCFSNDLVTELREDENGDVWMDVFRLVLTGVK